MRLFRNFLIGLFLTIVGIGALLFIPSQQPPAPMPWQITIVGIGALLFIPSQQPPAPMPWQITIMPDGKSSIFGIHLGTTTYNHTKELFHEFGKIAVFAQEGKPSTVEAFFDSVHLGGITGKLVLNLDVPEPQIIEMMSRAYKARLQDSGAHRYELRNSDNASVVNAPIIAITYVPSVKLDADIARFRFGEPGSISQDTLDANTTIWNYPLTGLTIRINEHEKTVLQYQ